MNNRLEYCRIILPDIGRKEPTEEEIKEEERVDLILRRMQKERKDLKEQEKKTD